MARKDATAARHAVTQMLALDAGYAPGWLTASILSLQLGSASRALQEAKHGLALTPNTPALRVQHVRCLIAAGQLIDARAAILDAEPLLRGHPGAQHELGNACAALGDYRRALALMRTAATALPDNPTLNFNMAAVLRYLGQFDEAETRLNHTIRYSPNDWEAYGTRSQLRTQTADDNHIDELEAVLAGGPSEWMGNVQVRYALAKEYEDLFQYERAFAHLSAGATLRRRHLRYDVHADIAAISDIIRVFDAKWWAHSRCAAACIEPVDSSPIFVFGLPRSGSTLVDRILSCHPDVISRGELNDFPAAVIACAGDRGKTTPKQELVQRASLTDPGLIGATYAARFAQFPGAAPRFIDKLPMNYLYAGLIAASLPGATLVHVSRHPMANAFGMYKTLFHQGYPFSYDLDELGRYVAAYLNLIAHWRELLGDRLITINYERLVTDQDAATRTLVAACGLTWHPACLSPHRNPAPSNTQSAVQIRLPVHAGATDQWRHFASQLVPLSRWLDDNGTNAFRENR